MHHHKHNHDPVYFTLIPSHDCDDINLQMFCLQMFCWYSIFLFLFIAQSTLFRGSSQIQTLIYLLPTPRISTKTLFYIVLDISQRVLLHTAPKFKDLLLCVYSSFLLRGSVYCKCTNWSFEADMAVSLLILCHYKFIYTPIIKVPSLFHGGRCVGSPAVAIHAYLC